jgi:hypothetical protein
MTDWPAEAALTCKLSAIAGRKADTMKASVPTAKVPRASTKVELNPEVPGARVILVSDLKVPDVLCGGPTSSITTWGPLLCMFPFSLFRSFPSRFLRRACAVGLGRWLASGLPTWPGRCCAVSRATSELREIGVLTVVAAPYRRGILERVSSANDAYAELFDRNAGRFLG